MSVHQVCTVLMEARKEWQIPQELEWQMVVSYHVHAGD